MLNPPPPPPPPLPQHHRHPQGHPLVPGDPHQSSSGCPGAPGHPSGGRGGVAHQPRLDDGALAHLRSTRQRRNSGPVPGEPGDNGLHEVCAGGLLGHPARERHPAWF